MSRWNFVATVVGTLACVALAAGVLGGWSMAQGKASPKSNAPQEAPTEGKGSALPKVPAYVDGVVISNPGVAAVVGQFFQLLQDESLAVETVVGAPFLMDGRQRMEDMKAISAFMAKAREGSLKKKQTSTFVAFRILPPGNTWEVAQSWLAPLASGDRARALFDHAAKHDGWLVLAQTASQNGDEVNDEDVLLAVASPKDGGAPRVIGFMD